MFQPIPVQLHPHAEHAGYPHPMPYYPQFMPIKQPPNMPMGGPYLFHPSQSYLPSPGHLTNYPFTVAPQMAHQYGPGPSGGTRSYAAGFIPPNTFNEGGKA
jgi:hypothetical protein